MREEVRAQVGQAGWGAEELGEGAWAVVEDVSAPWKRDWSGQHFTMWRQRARVLQLVTKR